MNNQLNSIEFIGKTESSVIKYVNYGYAIESQLCY